MATYDESAESAESAQPAEDTEGAVPADIQAERERRLDPANRPANAEVDYTGENMPDVARD